MIYVCEHHHEVLSLWQHQNLRGIMLTHVDFHDDMRGLLVDRRRWRAYPIGRLAEGNSKVDDGNFLAYAVLEGRLDRVRWLHGVKGGRAWDLGIVRYETDVFALFHRLRHALLQRQESIFRFEEICFEEWEGLTQGERLSLDWDCFASILLDRKGVNRRVKMFLDRLGLEVPPDTYIAYSPEYCHPTLEAFKELLTDLKRRFRQRIEWLSPGLERGEFHPTGVDSGPPHNPIKRLILAMRRIGIY